MEYYTTTLQTDLLSMHIYLELFKAEPDVEPIIIYVDPDTQHIVMYEYYDGVTDGWYTSIPSTMTAMSYIPDCTYERLV